MANYLSHHGVIGMRWGKRNGPPYPLKGNKTATYVQGHGYVENRDRPSLEKGTIIRTVSINRKSKDVMDGKRWLYAYDPKKLWDANVYEGGFAMGKVYQGAEFVYTHDFKIKKDLKMPTFTERRQEFIDMYNDPKWKKQIISTLRKVHDDTSGPAPDFSNLSTKTRVNQAYDYLNAVLEIEPDSPVALEYRKRISDKWDAMPDDNDRGIYVDVQDPLIIFRANEMLEKMQNTGYKLSREHMVKASKYINEHLSDL